jgi:hypothetical protein
MMLPREIKQLVMHSPMLTCGQAGPCLLGRSHLPFRIGN